MQQAKSLVDQLVALNNPVSNEDLEAVLSGLGHAYHPFGWAIEACLETVTFKDLHGLLLSEKL